jgi:hypothetical protein
MSRMRACTCETAEPMPSSGAPTDHHELRARRVNEGADTRRPEVKRREAALCPRSKQVGGAASGRRAGDQR